MAEEAEYRMAMIDSSQSEIRSILQAYNQTVPEDRGLTLAIDAQRGLSVDELDKLSEHVSMETDASCRILLKQIVGLQGRIDDHNRALEKLTSAMPPPHCVRRGENHYTLSINYLTNTCGMSRGTADSIVSRTELVGDIIEGFNIWFHYEDERFSTFVTQGSARVSPAVFAKIVKQHIVEQARASGNEDAAFECILDSLKRSGALLSSIKHASAIGM